MFGAISEKFRTFDMQINFAFSPKFSLSPVVGGILFPFSKLRNFHLFINQLVALLSSISRQSLIRMYCYFFVSACQEFYFSVLLKSILYLK